jgi:hypothetical protein
MTTHVAYIVIGLDVHNDDPYVCSDIACFANYDWYAKPLMTCGHSTHAPPSIYVYVICALLFVTN